MGTEGLERLARDLAALHRPGTIDWEARFGLPKLLEAPALAAVPSAEPPTATITKPRGTGHRCASCGVQVSFAVVKFCWNNKERFGGGMYCLSCQSSFPR
jgi:hypothetical protein